MSFFGARGKERHGKRVDTTYVSEFASFMERFLEQHPEEITERNKGRALYWDHRVDLTALDKAEKDNVPDDRYGFDYSAWRIGKEQGGPGHSR